MHSFLAAIGFRNIKNREQEEKLIHNAIENATEKKIIVENDKRFAELTCEIAENIGIVLRGDYDKDDKFHVEHYFPYLRGSNVSAQEEIYICKRVDSDAYTGMCDDFRIGVSLIFYLQNAVDYLIASRQKPESPSYHPIILSGLAREGKVLLPVKKDKNAERISNANQTHRSELLSEAKKGNQEAIESLTLDDMELYEKVSKRIMTEDIYSIVDTTFIPYGSESDNYTILGEIEAVRKEKNIMSGEEIYVMRVKCNYMLFEICVNKDNLLGEPLPGRRFRGNIWLQGTVEFEL